MSDNSESVINFSSILSALVCHTWQLYFPRSFFHNSVVFVESRLAGQPVKIDTLPVRRVRDEERPRLFEPGEPVNYEFEEGSSKSRGKDDILNRSWHSKECGIIDYSLTCSLFLSLYSCTYCVRRGSNVEFLLHSGYTQRYRATCGGLSLQILLVVKVERWYESKYTKMA